jgi:predicted nucleic acid-binding protein
VAGHPSCGPHPEDTALVHLDAEEREAILLADEQRADLLLMDDWEGCREAERRILRVTGTLGVLERAAERGWLDLPAVLARLQTTNCYLPMTLVRDLLARAASSFHVVNEIPERSFILFRALTLSLSW